MQDIVYEMLTAQNERGKVEQGENRKGSIRSACVACIICCEASLDNTWRDNSESLSYNQLAC